MNENNEYDDFDECYEVIEYETPLPSQDWIGAPFVW